MALVHPFPGHPEERFLHVAHFVAEAFDKPVAVETARSFEGLVHGSRLPRGYNVELQPVLRGDARLQGQLARACWRIQVGPRKPRGHVVVFFAKDAPADPSYGINALYAVRMAVDLQLLRVYLEPTEDRSRVEPAPSIHQVKAEARLFLLRLVSTGANNNPLRSLVQQFLNTTPDAPAPLALHAARRFACA